MTIQRDNGNHTMFGKKNKKREREKKNQEGGGHTLSAFYEKSS